MKCPKRGCGKEMQFQGYPHHKYEYYLCRHCGTEVRIIYGDKKGMIE